MALYLRMIVYALAAGAAALGIATYDPVAQTITFDLNSLSLALGGAITFAGTFFASRIAKARGGKT